MHQKKNPFPRVKMRSFLQVFYLQSAGHTLLAFSYNFLMTAEEKTALARFLDLADDYLRDGHVSERENYAFADEALPEKSSLPLAYMIEEPSENDDYQADSADSTDFLKSAESVEPENPLKKISDAITACRSCSLGATRKNAVPGEGVSNPLVMVIGEGPGADEDSAGKPFVGKAGQLLDKMLASIGLSRDKNCYIANMVKCRPPENRDPGPDEITACLPYLEQQITLLKPRLILCAGRVAAQNLLKTSAGINALRGKFIEFKLNQAAVLQNEEMVIPLLPTYHPSALLRDESLKRPAWEDLKLLRTKLGSLNEE